MMRQIVVPIAGTRSSGTTHVREESLFSKVIAPPVRLCVVADAPWTLANIDNRARLHYLSTSPCIAEYIEDMICEWNRILWNNDLLDVHAWQVSPNPRFVGLIRPNIAITDMQIWFAGAEWIPYRRTVLQRAHNTTPASTTPPTSPSTSVLCMLYINCRADSPWYNYILVSRNGERSLHAFGSQNGMRDGSRMNTDVAK